MSLKIPGAKGGGTRPSSRGGAAAEAVFYPGEVVTILGLDGIDYRQLRMIYRTVRELRGESAPAKRDWARFTLADLAATEVFISLAGGRESLRPGRRLVLKPIREACRALRVMGIADPLLEVSLARDGRSVLALVGECVLEPVTGQLAFETAALQVEKFLAEELIKNRQLRAAIRSAKSKVPKKQVVVARDGLKIIAQA